MANHGRRMTAHGQSPLALAKSSLSKLAKRFHSGPGDKFRVKILKRELVQLSDPARKLEPRDELSLLTIHPKNGSAPLVVTAEDPLVVEPTGDMPKGQHKLPIMVVRQMGEECTSICDENESKKTSPSPNHPENYLAFAIAYILSSFLPLTEKSLPAVQKAVANNIEHPDFSELSSQPPPHQYPLSPFGGDPFYLPDGGNGYGEGCGELPGGLPGGCGSNYPDDDDSSHGAGQGSNGEGGDGSQGKGKGADTNSPQFACPFFRHDPFLYEKCLKFKLSRYSDVKQHIKRYHVVDSYYCHSCMQKWKTDCPEYEAHMAAGCTKASTHKYLDKEEVETIIGRSRARGRTGMDNWMEMWRRLFPEDEKLVSPFLDTYFVEMTNACRDRNRLKIEEKLKSWIAAGGEPTPEEMREMVTEIQDLCLNTAPVEARPSRVPNHVYAKSTGSLSIQVQESRPRNHSDPGPSSLAVPCENHAPATAPLMYSQGSNEQYLLVPPREYRPSRNSMSALPFHTQPMATQEQPFLGPRSSSFSGGFTTTDSMFSATQNDVFNAANGLQYSEAADSSLLLEAYPTMASPWGIEDGLGAAQGLDSVAGRVQLDFEPPYLQDIPPHIGPQGLLGADSGMINTPELGSIGTRNTPHLIDVPSPSSSARSIQLTQPKRKASKSDAKQPTAKRGATRYSG
ncbi:unnamed protein product [Clonostachys rosea f. rosea IK726]|uniref:Uncharacterized protein n=1 Tax=Clonostachys rosea f. rosea IK726 TaxID=1349383 RepID=A0ACA9TJJ2_BIOOC|nr:unnamed protein product [Clonostachys rosea f. rosea IK726]